MNLIFFTIISLLISFHSLTLADSLAGDCNGDTKVNIEDVVCSISDVINPTALGDGSCDNNPLLNAQDILCTIDVVLNNGTQTSTNSPPSFTGSNVNYTVLLGSGTFVSNISASDPDGDTLNYSITAGNATFQLASNQLQFIQLPSSIGSYQVTIEINDGNGGSVSRDFLITVFDGSSRCGALPAHVVIVPSSTYSIDWSQPQFSAFLELDTTDTSSIPVHTSSATNSLGFIQFVGIAGTSNIVRTLWISDCPGDSELEAVCKVTGSEAPTRIDWSMEAITSNCNLNSNSDYFINIQNLTCTAPHCNIALDFFTNQ